MQSGQSEVKYITGNEKNSNEIRSQLLQTQRSFFQIMDKLVLQTSLNERISSQFVSAPEEPEPDEPSKEPEQAETSAASRPKRSVWPNTLLSGPEWLK